jgi:uncharacterized phiE125 gp8 family phage protein
MVKPLRCHEALERIEDAADLPVSVCDAKMHLRITSSAEDAYISDLVYAAVAMTDGLGTLGKAMITQKWRQYFGVNPGVAYLSIGPVQSVTKIAYYDKDGVEQDATLTDFDVFGNGNATRVTPKPGFSWPDAQDRPDAIWIEYEAGYGDLPSDVPAALRHAIKMLVAHWYENRENATEAGMRNIPYGYDALINTERARWYG